MRVLLKLVLVGLLLTAWPCHAAKWRMVGGVPESGIRVYVDDATLAVDHDYIVKGWVRFDYEMPRERDGHKLVAYASHRQVDCEANRYWIEEGWGYPGSEAEPVRLYSTAQEWQMPPPGSEAEIASAALCFETNSLFDVLTDKGTVFQGLMYVWQTIKSHIY